MKVSDYIVQFLREHIPNKIVCLNNSSLGMIRSWQARYMGSYGGGNTARRKHA